MVSTFTPDENFQTPLDVCEYMVSLLPSPNMHVFEPTPGLGNLVRTLITKGHKVTPAHDFFTFDKSLRFDAVVMNPPFSSKSAFLENAPADAEIKGMKLGYHILKQCLSMSDVVVALMPWYTIADSDVRLRFLRTCGI